MDAVSGGKAGIEKTETAEQRVHFDDIFQSFGYDAKLKRRQRVKPVGEEDIPARPGNGHARLAAAIARTDIIGRIRAVDGLSFEPGCQRVAHTGDKKTAGRFSDYFTVHKHKVRVLFHLARADIFPVWGIDDRDLAHRRIR